MNKNHPEGRDEELLPEIKKKKTPKPKKHMTLEDAIALATEAHEGQTDKLGKPYIEHPLRVMETIRKRHPDDVEMQIAAVFHDALEDTDMTVRHLRKEGASGRTIRIIEGLTHKKGVSNKEYWTQISLMYDTVEVKDADIKDNSDPERLAQIEDEATRERLTKKYERAREVIHTYYK